MQRCVVDPFYYCEDPSAVGEEVKTQEVTRIDSKPYIHTYKQKVCPHCPRDCPHALSQSQRYPFPHRVVSPQPTGSIPVKKS